MVEPRWLDEREQGVWRAYLTMNAQLSARLNKQLQTDSGLSISDFAVLVQLTDRPDTRARILELAEALQWEKSRLSHHLSRMEKRGLISREGCPTDARGSFVAITPAGQQAIDQAAPQHVDTVRDLLFDQLTPAQVDTFRDIAEQVLARLNRTE